MLGGACKASPWARTAIAAIAPRQRQPGPAPQTTLQLPRSVQRGGICPWWLTTCQQIVDFVGWPPGPLSVPNPIAGEGLPTFLTSS